MPKEASLNKPLYKIFLYLIKVIPMVMAFIFIVDTILSHIGIEIDFISYLSSNSILTLIFFYLSSYVFKFCMYHRMFIHYNTFTWLLNIYDWYIGIPVDARTMFMIYMVITFIFMLLILYLYVKSRNK